MESNVILESRDRVLANKGLFGRFKSFLYPDELAEEIAKDLKERGLEEEAKKYFEEIENLKRKREESEKEYKFWKEYRKEKLKNEILSILPEVKLEEEKKLGFIPTYHVTLSDGYLDKLKTYTEDEVYFALKALEKQTTGKNRKKVKAIRKEVERRSGGGRKKKIAFSILASGLMIGAAAGGWYWYTHKDTDNDGISDYLETHKYHTDPNNPDTDSDGINDYQEIFVYNTNPLLNDTDQDGLNDSFEIFELHSNPLKPSLMNETTIQEQIYWDMVKNVKNLNTVYMHRLGYEKPYYVAGDYVKVSYGNGYSYKRPMKFSSTGNFYLPALIVNGGKYKYRLHDIMWEPTLYVKYLDDLLDSLNMTTSDFDKNITSIIQDLSYLDNSLKNISENPADLQSFRMANGILTKYYDRETYIDRYNTTLSGNDLREYLTDFNKGNFSALEKSLFIVNEDRKIASSVMNSSDYVKFFIPLLVDYKKFFKGAEPIDKWSVNAMKLWAVESAVAMLMMNYEDYSEPMLKVVGLLDSPKFAKTKQEAKMFSDLPEPVSSYWQSFYDRLSTSEKQNFNKWIDAYYKSNDTHGIMTYMLTRVWFYDTPVKQPFKTSDVKKIDYGFRLTNARSFAVGDSENISFIRDIWKKTPSTPPKIEEVWDYLNSTGLAIPRSGNINYGPFTVEHSKEMNLADCATATAATIELLQKYYPTYVPVGLVKVFPITWEEDNKTYHAVGDHNMPLFYYTGDGDWHGIELSPYKKTPYSVSKNGHPFINLEGWAMIAIPFANAPIEIPLRDDNILKIMKKYVPNEIEDLIYMLRENYQNDL